MRFQTKRQDLAAVGAECDAAVHHGGQGTVARLLLAGEPRVRVPLTLGRSVLAGGGRDGGGGDGVAAGEDLAGRVLRAMRRVEGDGRYGEAARGIGRRYAAFEGREG